MAKERISKQVFQENNVRQIFQKKNISYPVTRIVRVRIRGKESLFLGKFGVFCFLETFVSRFALLPYYQRINPILLS